MAAIYSNGGNRWNILAGFNFTKRDALSSVYKISMGRTPPAPPPPYGAPFVHLLFNTKKLDYFNDL